jgi:adenosyl cobinamide kinase/adenosyl cobinamide phosphate guanylyltransferase
VALTVLLGGARSGKSRLAVELALDFGSPVTFLATGEARDSEMEARIAEHRAERPESWQTVEESHALEGALLGIDSEHVVVVDCLSLWVANLLERGDEPVEVLEAATRAAALAAARRSLTIVVSNEVGLGVVPATPLGRTYRDLLGSVNRVWVGKSAVAALVVAGRALPLSGARELLAPEAVPR